MTSEFDVFRHAHPVRVFGTSGFNKGVNTAGHAYDAEITCSVQRIPTNTRNELTARGKRVSDYRRIYCDFWLPEQDEPVIGSEALTGDMIPEYGDLFLPDTAGPNPGDPDVPGNRLVFAGRYDSQRGAAGTLPGQQKPKSQPAQVQINGQWYEVAERIDMTNGIINNYQYLLVRLQTGEQP